MLTNISDRKDTKFLSYYNTLSVEIKFHWQIILKMQEALQRNSCKYHTAKCESLLR